MLDQLICTTDLDRAKLPTCRDLARKAGNGNNLARNKASAEDFCNKQEQNAAAGLEQCL